MTTATRLTETQIHARALRVAGNAQRLDSSLMDGDAAYVEAASLIRYTGHATARQVVASLRRARQEWEAEKAYQASLS
jgi:ubiquinone biosynthesis protein UbiJ